MSSVRGHPNVTLWTYSEVIDVEGDVGNFKVRVKRRPRYIDEELCVGCQDCIEACVFKTGKFKDEFNSGLSKRKPIYIPFSQATPLVAVIDPETCIEFRTGKCKKTCVESCERDAVDLSQTEEIKEIEVGAIVVATGTGVYDPYLKGEYGYGIYPNVLTGLEYERMLSASGPTGGRVMRPSDGKPPQKVAFIQCVGVRDVNDGEYCSRFCCMNSAKCALLTKDHEPGVEEVSIHHIDLRAFGKGYEDFYRRTQAEPWIKYVRGKPSKILEDPETHDLILYTEDQATGRPEQRTVGLAVLASAGMPDREKAEKLAGILGIETDKYGFFVSRQINTHALESTREGVYFCGCARGGDRSQCR